MPSLAYHQVRKRSPNAAAKLVALSRSYLNSINRQSKGTLTLADSTGFATPSVLALLAASKDQPQLRDLNYWDPKTLFGDDLDPLTSRVATVANMPEMSLGDGTGTPFNPERVASILRDWVAGRSLVELANQYGHRSEQDDEKRLTEFSKYLFSTLLSQASWGLGALEGVCLAGNEQFDKLDAAYVPSMVFFGVPDKTAVWLRMAGVPRVVATGLASQWPTKDTIPDSFAQIRQWIGGRTDEEWQRGVPSGTALSVSQMKLLWNEFSG